MYYQKYAYSPVFLCHKEGLLKDKRLIQQHRSVIFTLSTPPASKQRLLVLQVDIRKNQKVELKRQQEIHMVCGHWGPVPDASWLFQANKSQKSLLEIVYRKDLEKRRKRERSNWYIIRKLQLSLYSFVIMEWIQLRFAKHTPAFRQRACTPSLARQIPEGLLGPSSTAKANFTQMSCFISSFWWETKCVLPWLHPHKAELFF